VVLGREDDTLRIVEMNALTAAEFVAGIRGELAHWQKRTALVFVHGYNVSFREAVLRAAQIGFDLRVDGIMALFSWPSKGDLLPYAADEASIELAEKHFVSFVELLSSVHEIETINVLAHSMGNRLVVRTVERLLCLKQEGKLAVPIGHIMLAAADVTATLFKQYAATYAALAAHRVTNYTYKADKALIVSRKLHDQSRVGLEPPVFVHDGIDTISVSELDLDVLGHGYIASAEPLLYDLAQLVHDNKPPRQRSRLEPMPPDVYTYWALAR
jgi:esterase/lipase superfamily enzyme